ncbi:MAG: hypothetical protein XD81_1074 [Bacteroidetes bacterium 38_7]|nr:MAG: hypothetical protein XD81_1074 [Bacteroidetes bacterium 38_7]
MQKFVHTMSLRNAKLHQILIYLSTYNNIFKNSYLFQFGTPFL